MNNQFIVLTRYEMWVPGNVKAFCKWFALDSTPRSENEAKAFIKEKKKMYNEIDNKLKLSHEYMLQPYEEYLNERETVKENIAKNVARNEAYYKSDAYKELCKKKRQSAKERKKKQKKYLEEHQKHNE